MLNFGTYDLETVGEWDIPAIKAVKDFPVLSRWLNFRERKTDNPANCAVHFFLDDYRFETVWNQPERYVNELRQYAAVLSPDFSMYIDMPHALQLYNHYRRQWLAAYWQRHGVNVIPTISWSDPKSFDFCFVGIPRGGIVAVSSVGCMKNTEAKSAFMRGYEEMMCRLDPCAVLYYGVKHYDGAEIIDMGEPFYSKFKKKGGE